MARLHSDLALTPAGRQAMAVGTAGLTAMLAVMALQFIAPNLISL
jgi:hypothetical protein